jgi:hypothetical protein
MRIAIYGGLTAVALAACAALAEKEGAEVVAPDDLPTSATAEPADAVVCQLGHAAVQVSEAYEGTDTPIFGQALDEDLALVEASGGWQAFALFLGVHPAPAAAVKPTG